MDFPLHLLGQFTSRHEDESARAALCVLAQTFGEDDSERDGLPRACRGLAANVATF
jgi:hypothetical protein